MALAAWARFFGTDDGNIDVGNTRNSPRSGRDKDTTSRFASLFDMKCCAQRERSEADSFSTGRATSKPFPEPLTQQRPTSMSTRSSEPPADEMYSGDYGLDSSTYQVAPEMDCRPLHLPRKRQRQLVDQLAFLIDRNPYVAREIHERASSSLHFRFLKCCMLRSHDQSQVIWDSLNELDRLDFLEVFNMGREKTPDGFLMRLMETDVSRDHVSDYSWSELEMRSDAGSASSGESRLT